jgi:hypothetical protein
MPDNDNRSSDLWRVRQKKQAFVVLFVAAVGVVGVIVKVASQDYLRAGIFAAIVSAICGLGIWLWRQSKK